MLIHFTYVFVTWLYHFEIVKFYLVTYILSYYRIYIANSVELILTSTASERLVVLLYWIYAILVTYNEMYWFLNVIRQFYVKTMSIDLFVIGLVWLKLLPLSTNITMDPLEFKHALY